VISLLDAALAYAARGGPVIPLAWPTATGDEARCSCDSFPELRGDEPCKPKRIGKHPHGLLVRKGLEEASCNAQRVRQWWARAPHANIGLVLGEEAAMWALDVDPDHGGDRTLVDLVRDHGPLGDTLHAFSGSGGDHIFFAHPGEPVRNRGIGQGLDVRGDAGYVVAAPSMHASGVRYAWEPGPRVALPAPAWLLALVFPPEPPIPEPPSRPTLRDPSARRPDVRERAALYLAALPPAIQGQRGSDDCFRAAVHLVRGFGLDEASALQLLVEHYNPRCQPPWSPRELQHKVKSATRSQLPHGYLLDAQ
jgi:hypothetical protein